VNNRILWGADKVHREDRVMAGPQKKQFTSESFVRALRLFALIERRVRATGLSHSVPNKFQLFFRAFRRQGVDTI